MSLSVSAPSYSDPDRLVPFLASERADTAAEARNTDQAQGKKQLSMFAEGDDSPSFWDLVDVINPLQHIPVVNTLYQEVTGDKIGVGARLAGGTLFGGPIGLAASAVDCMIEAETGDDVGGHVLAMFRDDAATTAPTTAIASAAPAATPATTASQSAAAAVAAAPLTAIGTAQAVSLPDLSAPLAGAGQNGMAFSLDGQINAAPSPVSLIPAAPASSPVKPTVEALSASPAAAQQTLGQNQRIMPVPERRVAQSAQAPAPISVPVSNGSGRSNVPVTGRDPAAARNSANAMAVQKAMAQQGIANVQHPMLPSADGSTNTSSNGNDWFSSAFNQAMDKYQKSSQLNQPQTTAQTTAPAANLY